MPLPFIIGAVGAKVVLGATVATGVVGAAKGVKGVMDSKEAGEVQDQAESILNDAKNDLDLIKDKTSEGIMKLGETKLKASANEIKKFVDVFSKIRDVDLKDSLGLEELKSLNIKNESMADMKETALGAINVLSGGIAGVGAGALLGWGAYGGVMALGTASTGAAIGGLSGVAATNATLAWLGGGALAAGGGGMALGSAVLGGIVAGPALLLAGGLFGAKAKEKLNNAYSNLAEAYEISEELKTAGIQLNIIRKKANKFNKVLKKLVKQLDFTIDNMAIITERELDWRKYTQDEKSVVAMSVKYAQIVKAMIDTPLLTEDGVLTKEISEVLNNKEIKELLSYNI